MSDNPTRLWGLYYKWVVLPTRPLGQFLQRRWVVAECPSMAVVFRQLASHYRVLNATERSVHERNKRGLGEDSSLTFGELNWRSFVHLLRRVQPQQDDVFVELGCGTGQFGFYVNRRYGIPVVAVDRLACFVELGERIAMQLGINDVHFERDDLLSFESARGSIFYVTTTCFRAEQMRQLTERLKLSSTGTRVIVVGQPLHLLRQEGFVEEPPFRCGSSWGSERAWIYRK